MAGTRQLAWIGGLLAVALLLLALSPLPLSGALESSASVALAPAVTGARAAVRPIADVMLHAGQIQRLSMENATLRQEVERLRAERIVSDERTLATAQDATLREAAGTAASGGITAAVVLYDPDPTRRLISIDHGEQAGLRIGQPVIGASGALIGVVAAVQSTQARVRLLTDARSAVTATVQSSRTPGALAGTGTGLRLEFVPLGAAVHVGDFVISSPLGGQLPAGLPVGRVTDVQTDARELFQRVAVEPLADLTRLERVLVITGGER